jgi:hypothetical protein
MTKTKPQKTFHTVTGEKDVRHKDYHSGQVLKLLRLKQFTYCVVLTLCDVLLCYKSLTI